MISIQVINPFVPHEILRLTIIWNSTDHNFEVDHVLEVSKSTMVMVISNSDCHTYLRHDSEAVC